LVTDTTLFRSFGGNRAGIIGDFRWFAFQSIGMDVGPYSDSLPHMAFAAFQMMFAIITACLITGAVVGRMRFGALFAFTTLWFFVVRSEERRVGNELWY